MGLSQIRPPDLRMWGEVPVLCGVDVGDLYQRFICALIMLMSQVMNNEVPS